MSQKKPTLPLSWYFTPAELAHDWGVHPDRIMYYCDAGLIEPGVLAPKGQLPLDCPGPAPHICVLRPLWRPTNRGARAPAHLLLRENANLLKGERFESPAFHQLVTSAPTCTSD